MIFVIIAQSSVMRHNHRRAKDHLIFLGGGDRF